MEQLKSSNFSYSNSSKALGEDKNDLENEFSDEKLNTESKNEYLDLFRKSRKLQNEKKKGMNK